MKMIRKIPAFLTAFALLLSPGLITATARSTVNGDAKTIVLAAAAAMGGLDRLRALKSVEFEAMGHWNLLEQSERPDGPWIIAYDDVRELRDHEHQRLRQTSLSRYFSAAKGQSTTMVVADGVA